MVGETVSSLYVINNYFKLRDPEKDPLKHQVPYSPPPPPLQSNIWHTSLVAQW